MNVLKSFSQFKWSELWLNEQEFDDYKSKYLDLYDKSRTEKEGDDKASIIQEVDFELELIQRDEINVAYILALLAKLKEAEQSDDAAEHGSYENRKQAILDMLGTEVQLHSKRELIEKFISEYLPNVKSAEQVEDGFDTFWNEEREKGLVLLCTEEGLKRDEVEQMIAAYHFTQRPPLRDQIVSALDVKPKILDRKTIIERVTRKLLELITTFDDA
jgi:type I restriction enzyme R subunit